MVTFPILFYLLFLEVIPMNDIELSKEAKMQIKALKKISQWKTFIFGISIIGVAITYAGLSGTEKIFL